MEPLTYGQLPTEVLGTGLYLLDSAGNRWSAQRGDYWMCAPDEPVLDEDDEPMRLVREQRTYEVIA